ncbi:MAG TPA: hypothetical protein VGJ21_12670 [Terracidiphilus sp.]|jgi:hypothetical protein
MSSQPGPLAALTDAALDTALRRATRITLILGGVWAVILWIASGWRNAAMLAVGAALSAASILEWRRLIRIFNAKLDRQITPRGTAIVITLFLLRLLIFAGVIYGSLKGLRGSPIVLLCGLALALLAIAWEALRLLRD